MKKVISVIIGIAAFMAIAISAGCSVEEQQGGVPDIETYVSAAESIAEAEKIEELITLKSGALTPYEYKKEYTSGANGYTVRETTTTYNKIESGEEELKKVETAEPYQVSRNSEAVPTLNLSEGLFEELKINESKLTGKVAEGKLQEVLGIGETLEAPVTNPELEITLGNSKITSISITYTSKSYTVSLLISFAY